MKNQKLEIGQKYKIIEMNQNDSFMDYFKNGYFDNGIILIEFDNSEYGLFKVKIIGKENLGEYLILKPKLRKIK